ncbi:hypothetical protein E2C01_097989 [Portunus trituberculatus]|uniref:Uncharacterized protein n=1 Tax=Portunus trituberculatus TaxID=210409 RepID=A0A5B7K5U5_PORTR|nr:hypothetical protein [Portunus trituberculatus]
MRDEGDEACLPWWPKITTALTNGNGGRIIGTCLLFTNRQRGENTQGRGRCGLGNALRQKEKVTQEFHTRRKTSRDRRETQEGVLGVSHRPATSSAFPQQRWVISPHQLINTDWGSHGV